MEPAAIIYTVSKIIDLFLSFPLPPSSSETSNNSRVAIYSVFIVSPSRVIVVINTLIKIRYSFENLCTNVSSTVDEKKKKDESTWKINLYSAYYKNDG